MITIVDSTVVEMRGLSTDTKPIEYEETVIIDDKEVTIKHYGPANGSTFFEMDTSKTFMYNKDANAYIELTVTK